MLQDENGYSSLHIILNISVGFAKKLQVEMSFRDHCFTLCFELILFIFTAIQKLNQYFYRHFFLMYLYLCLTKECVYFHNLKNQFPIK